MFFFWHLYKIIYISYENSSNQTHFQCFYFLKIKNKKSNQTYFQNSNLLKIKTENENANQIHPKRPKMLFYCSFPLVSSHLSEGRILCGFCKIFKLFCNILRAPNRWRKRKFVHFLAFLFIFLYILCLPNRGFIHGK